MGCNHSFCGKHSNNFIKGQRKCNECVRIIVAPPPPPLPVVTAAEPVVSPVRSPVKQKPLKPDPEPVKQEDLEPGEQESKRKIKAAEDSYKKINDQARVSLNI